MAEPQKLKVTQTSTKAQAAGAGSLGVSSLVVAIVQLLQIQMTPEQLAALVTIAGALAAFGGAWFATNSPVVQDSEQEDAAIPVEPDAGYEAFRRWDRAGRPAPGGDVASVPTAVVDAARKVG